MRVLTLDTNPLYWWLAEPHLLSPNANEALEQATMIFVSAGTMLDLMEMLDPSDFAKVERTLSEDPRYNIASISFGVLTLASEWTPSIGPIRRAILANALYNRCPFVTDDPEMTTFFAEQTDLATSVLW